MTAVARKRNVPGYIDDLGRFRPIRSASYVGSGSSRRPAKASDRKKYSRAKGGDLGKLKQERALEAPWDREDRLRREEAERIKREQDRIEKQIAAEAFGETDRTSRGKALSLAQFVRKSGGIRRTFRHGGTKFRGKRSSWDAGEIDRLSPKESGTTGLTTSDPRRGKTMDKMFQSAREAGYDVGSPDEMMQALESEIYGGKATYATGGTMAYNPRKRNSKKPSASQLAKAAISVFDNDLDLDVDSRDVRRLQRGEKSVARKKKNPDVLGMFANAAVGIASALQIKEHMNRPKRKAAPKRRGTTTAKRKNPASTAVPRSLNVLTVRTGERVDAVYLHDGKSGGFGKKFKSLSAAKSFATRNKIKLVENPSPKVNGVLSRALARAKAKREYGKELRAEAAAARARSRRQKAESKAKANPKAAKLFGKTFAQLVAVAKKAGKREFNVPAFMLGDAHAYVAKNGGSTKNAGGRLVYQLAKANPRIAPSRRRAPKCKRCNHALSSHDIFGTGKSPCEVRGCQCSDYQNENVRRVAKKPNPKTTARRRTYEMFQGRRATKATPMMVSHHAPARLDALGDLVAIKIAGMSEIKLNGKRVKLCAANGKLWIAGKRFAKPNPSAPAHEINPIGEIAHVVYGTYKPHHGDHNYTHYIHKLGEESGVRPVLCVDREGFPVIRGGNYKIEARGIVD